MNYMLWASLEFYVIPIIWLLYSALSIVFLLEINVVMGLIANDIQIDFTNVFNMTSLLFGFIISCVLIVWLYKERSDRSNQAPPWRIFISEFIVIFTLLITNYIMSAVVDGYALFFESFKLLGHFFSGLYISYLNPLIVALLGASLLALLEVYFSRQGVLSHNFLRYSLLDSLHQDKLRRRHQILDILLIFTALEINVIMGLNLGTSNLQSAMSASVVRLGLMGASIFILLSYLINRYIPYPDHKDYSHTNVFIGCAAGR